jgi:hypothetical protein
MAVERRSVGVGGESGILHIVDVDAANVFEARRARWRDFRPTRLKPELSLKTVLVVHVPNGEREYRVLVRQLLAWFDAPGRHRVHRYQLKLLLTRPQLSPRVNARSRAH